MDLENFDPFSDDEVPLPTLPDFEAESVARIAQLRDELRTPGLSERRIKDLKRAIYDEQVNLTGIRKVRALEAEFDRKLALLKQGKFEQLMQERQK